MYGSLLSGRILQPRASLLRATKSPPRGGQEVGVLPEARARGPTVPSNIIPRSLAHVQASSHAMYGVDVMQKSGGTREDPEWGDSAQDQEARAT